MAYIEPICTGVGKKAGPDSLLPGNAALCPGSISGNELCLCAEVGDGLTVDVELDRRSKSGLSTSAVFPMAANVPFRLEPGATDTDDCLLQLLPYSRALLHCQPRSGSLPSLVSSRSKCFGGGSGGGGD